jgi:lysyl-tRNA synthetase class 2
MTYALAATLDALRLRAEVLARIRAFFAARGVLEVETPALSRAAPTDPALESIALEVRSLGGRHYLHTSPEFAMKRLLASGSGDIYQICRVFRDDELGRWHEPEFTLLEWYRVGFDDARLMDEVAEVVEAALGAAIDHEPPARGRRPRARSRLVERVSYRAAFEAALGIDPLEPIAPRNMGLSIMARLAELGVDVPPRLDLDALLDLAFSTVVLPSFRSDALTFVHDYPAAQAALARLKPGTPPVAARFELFAGGIELANGFAELTDAGEQRRRFEADLQERRAGGLHETPVDEAFLEALESGLPECAGVALGVDRLVALAAGEDALARVLAFTHRSGSLL